MTCPPLPHAAAALLALALAIPAAADIVGSAASGASSASSAGSASVGSVSDSIRGSSNSSSRETQVAEGEYRVVGIGGVEGRDGRLRLALQAAGAGEAAAGGLWLELPAQALAPRGLAIGDRVRVRQRPYGIEFSRADTREPFFLVLADRWFHELEARALTL